MTHEQLAARRNTLDTITAVTQFHLSQHRGREKGIGVAELSVVTGLSARTLREAISELRTRGHAVVGTPETGYYIAQTPGEVEECCRFLRARALHSLTIEARLRRLALPELLGQLALELQGEEVQI